jgi:tetratricopeptide (TPR) repeat protein
VDDPAALTRRGNDLLAKRQLAEALDCFDRALAQTPDAPEPHNNRGIVLRLMGRAEDALGSLDRAIALRPDFAEAYDNRGHVLRDLNRADEALDSHDRAIALKPDLADPHCNRGHVLLGLGRTDEAMACFERAIALRPNFAEAFNNRAIGRRTLHDLAGAFDDFSRAVRMRPDYVEAWSNLGNLASEQGDYPQSVAFYRRAIALNPDYADAHRNLGLCHLLNGHFAAGWEENEWRWACRSQRRYKRNFAQPLWRGAEPLRGRTILLHSEQGLGDTIQFCRYAKAVADRGARVLLEVEPPLVELLAIEGVAQVIAKGAPLPGFDLHCPLLTLPLALGTEPATIPSARRYLGSDGGRAAGWVRRLGPRRRPRVGLVWSGNPAHANDDNRSIPLAEFATIGSQRVDLISLQPTIRDGDRAALAAHPRILDFGAELRTFADTAALCDQLDLVISVDTAVAHLAGALGKPVWILLPAYPDWRWLRDRSDSPWYPSARLYRNESRQSWSALLARLHADLDAAF